MISTGLLLITTAILVVGYFQLQAFKKANKIEFTYRVYMDFFIFLNKPDNSDLKLWMFGKDVEVKDKDIRIGDILEKFEAMNSLMKTGSMDDGIFYDTMGFYVEKSFSAHNPSAMEYIDNARKEEKNNLKKTSDLYDGTIALWRKVKYMSV